MLYFSTVFVLFCTVICLRDKDSQNSCPVRTDWSADRPVQKVLQTLPW